MTKPQHITDETYSRDVCDFCTNQAAVIYVRGVSWDQCCDKCAVVMHARIHRFAPMTGEFIDIGSDEWKVWAVTRKLTR